jgi:glycosyltransferase involved in cell wall biosynthesis
MPCLNEKDTVSICVAKAIRALTENNIEGEVIVADNGSTDGSIEIAKEAGARVVHVNVKGYGAALIGGINSAEGRFIIMADSDDSYDFLGIMPFVEKLREGFDLVMGNRFKGGVKEGAMPFLHRYLGNPVLSGIGRLFFGSKIGDFHCGMRGFTKKAFFEMNLQTTGMEFASEMVVKSTLLGMKTTEIPTTLSPDGRTGKPHLRSFRDGWRHLRFLLMYSPRWLFLYPGLFMMIIGGLVSTFIFYNTNSKWDIHTLLYALASVMIGLQAVIFAIFSKTLAVNLKLLPMNSTIDMILSKLTLEKGLLVGGFLILTGLFGAVYAIAIWEEGVFFELGITITMRLVIASFSLLVMGSQIVFSSFFLSALKLNIHNN